MRQSQEIMGDRALWSPADDLARRLHPVSPERVVPAAGVRLLEVDAAMEQAVPAREQALALAHVIVPLLDLGKGRIDLDRSPQLRRPFAAIVVDGVVIRSTTMGGRTAAELLGSDDLIVHEGEAPAVYVAHTPVSLAILDDRFRVAARRWPGLHDVVYAAMARELRAAVEHGALLHLSRVEDRIVALFSRLAARWGRVTPAGIEISVRLSHELVGELVGARRPTVSLALGQLAGDGVIQRRESGVWVLRHDALIAA